MSKDMTSRFNNESIMITKDLESAKSGKSEAV